MTPFAAVGVALGGLALVGGGVVTVLVLTTSGPFASDDDGDPQAVVSATAEPTSVSSPSSTAAAPTPSPAEGPTAEATTTSSPAAGVKTYVQQDSDQSASFSFEYPDDWIVRGGIIQPGVSGLALSVFSYNVDEPADSPDIPDGETKVGIYVAPAIETVECADTDANPVQLGDLAARETVRDAPFSEPPEMYLSRIVSIEATKPPFTYCVVGYFTADNPDESGFRIITDSFEVD